MSKASVRESSVYDRWQISSGLEVKQNLSAGHRYKTATNQPVNSRIAVTLIPIK